MSKQSNQRYRKESEEKSFSDSSYSKNSYNDDLDDELDDEYEEDLVDAYDDDYDDCFINKVKSGHRNEIDYSSAVSKITHS